MSTITANNASAAALGDLGLALRQNTAARKELGQADFLKLMTTQLQHQDPFKPMDNGEFIAQIAQFSTVSGIQNMQASLGALSASLQSSQTLQAAQLVGSGVLVPGNSGYLFAEGKLGAAAELPSGGQLVVEVCDASGATVRRLDLGIQPAGLTNFDWDGRDESGRRLPEGSYQLKPQLIQGAQTQALSTYAVGLVHSVSLGSNGISLNLYGMDTVSLDRVRQIL